nr:transcriptional regulator [Pyrinomonadaceae bacterium]
EAGPDFSAETCPQASLSDLDLAAIEDFRVRWRRKTNNDALVNLSAEQLLTDAELMVDGKLTYAALVLFGTRQALGRYLAQAEVIFEYRSSEASGPAAQRIEFRQGFLLFRDELWQTINLRNDVQHFQDGLFVYDVPTFNEVAVREAILNAVSHRDYRHGGSIFVRQYPRKLEIVSPGGFPPGITTENILWQQFPRNRRIAEACVKCGLVERAGQGANRIVEECIKESKSLPDFSGTDAYQVFITYHGEIKDPLFLRFLNKLEREQVASFTTRDWLVLDSVRRNQPIADDLQSNLSELLREGLIEKIGRGRGMRYVLGREFVSRTEAQSPTPDASRQVGRFSVKNSLLELIADSKEAGVALNDLMQAQPDLTRRQVQNLLRELLDEGRVRVVGRTKAARWYI